MITAEKHAAMEESEAMHEDATGVTFQVVLEVICGSLLALWGGIGEFKPGAQQAPGLPKAKRVRPIRMGDSKKPRWESASSWRVFISS